MDVCVVFVCNKTYFHKFVYTCTQLIENGKYKGDICLVIGNDLLTSDLLKNEFIINNKIIIRHFPDIEFSKDFINVNKTIQCDKTKVFQWHKLHLFNVYFKQWRYVFYLDCGITIFSDITPILYERKPNTLLAHSDAYPTYKWKLHDQFCKYNKEYFTKLSCKYNLDIDYFQTTIMLYDTKIIEEKTYRKLIQIANQFPISRTNDQGIIALYFTNVCPVFEQLKTHNNHMYFYDYLSRNSQNKYIMLKLI